MRGMAMFIAASDRNLRKTRHCGIKYVQTMIKPADICWKALSFALKLFGAPGLESPRWPNSAGQKIVEFVLCLTDKIPSDI